NGFPLDVNLQLTFLDSNFNILDSLIDPPKKLFASAIVDGNGRVTQRTLERTEIEFPEERMDNIREARKILMRASFETIGAQQDKRIKIYSDYFLGIDLAMQAGMVVKLGGGNKDEE
ncbi:MAG: hypothetical protein IH946_10740, partial [Bacteroidetes bacterium]|nr:hypothetical protein [Bacteroidota bacterium]